MDTRVLTVYCPGPRGTDASIFIDGVPVTGVRRLVLTMDAGQMNVADVELIGGVDVVVRATVRVRGREKTDWPLPPEP